MTESYDTVVKGGRLATALGTFDADIAIRDGRVAALGETLKGSEIIDARGLIVTPAGVEAHCHVAQESGAGFMQADDYESASRAAALGGTGTIVPFASKTRDRTVAASLDLYAARAEGRSVLDYAQHLILPDAAPATIAAIPEAFARGVTALKIFTTYDGVRVDDDAMLAILKAAAAHGRLVMVHAECHAIIKDRIATLIAEGKTHPRFHAEARPREAEEEAIFRTLTLARSVGAAVMIVHVSTAEGAQIIAKARAGGARIWGETCTQYLALTAEDLDRPALEAAKYVCSPPPRTAADQHQLWRHLARGSLSLFSSDHAPHSHDAQGKFATCPEVLETGEEPPFTKIANGVPGIMIRLPYLFSQGVMAGRISLERFVALTASNAARLYGLAPDKGSLAVGAHADLTLWDPEARWTVPDEALGDRTKYTPYAGLTLTGRPVLMLQRGIAVMRRGEVVVPPGTGRRLIPSTPDLSEQPGRAPRSATSAR
ncbi:MAG: dihydropyrimidinase [Pseudomonadota bacterium]